MLNQEDKELYDRILALLGSATMHELGLSYLGTDGITPLPWAQRNRIRAHIQEQYGAMALMVTGNSFDWLKLFKADTIVINLKTDSASIGSLPDLSMFSNLRHLQLHDAKMRTLPKLPSGLNYLYCCNCELVSLGAHLPDSLETICCAMNRIERLPKLPSGLKTLSLGANRITELPKLPCTLERLEICENPIASLPDLPPKVERVFARGTLIPIADRGLYITKFPTCTFNFQR